MGKPKSRVADAVQVLDLVRETLTGDLRDYFLEMLRREKSGAPWNMRPEAEQHEVVQRVTFKVEEAVAAAVELIAADGRKTIKAHVEQVVVKDTIKAVLLLSKSDEQRHELFDATGSDVVLVVSDASAYQGQRAPAKITPDQRDAFDDSGDRLMLPAPEPIQPPSLNGEDHPAA